jgi:hypothetical protein
MNAYMHTLVRPIYTYLPTYVHLWMGTYGEGSRLSSAALKALFCRPQLYSCHLILHVLNIVCVYVCIAVGVLKE